MTPPSGPTGSIEVPSMATETDPGAGVPERLNRLRGVKSAARSGSKFTDQFGSQSSVPAPPVHDSMSVYRSRLVGVVGRQLKSYRYETTFTIKRSKCCI